MSIARTRKVTAATSGRVHGDARGPVRACATKKSFPSRTLSIARQDYRRRPDEKRRLGVYVYAPPGRGDRVRIDRPTAIDFGRSRRSTWRQFNNRLAAARERFETHRPSGILVSSKTTTNRCDSNVLNSRLFRTLE